MTAERILCPDCLRTITIRKDGRVRMHLAEYGQRRQCEGSHRIPAKSGFTVVPNELIYDPQIGPGELGRWVLAISAAQRAGDYTTLSERKGR